MTRCSTTLVTEFQIKFSVGFIVIRIPEMEKERGGGESENEMEKREEERMRECGMTPHNPERGRKRETKRQRGGRKEGKGGNKEGGRREREGEVERERGGRGERDREKKERVSNSHSLCVRK